MKQIILLTLLFIGNSINTQPRSLKEQSAGTSFRYLTSEKGLQDFLDNKVDLNIPRELAEPLGNKLLRHWKLNQYQLSQTLRKHTGWVYSVVFSSDDYTLASGSFDRTIKYGVVMMRGYGQKHNP